MGKRQVTLSLQLIVDELFGLINNDTHLTKALCLPKGTTARVLWTDALGVNVDVVIESSKWKDDQYAELWVLKAGGTVEYMLKDLP